MNQLQVTSRCPICWEPVEVIYNQKIEMAQVEESKSELLVRVTLATPEYPVHLECQDQFRILKSIRGGYRTAS